MKDNNLKIIGDKEMCGWGKYKSPAMWQKAFNLYVPSVKRTVENQKRVCWYPEETFQRFGQRFWSYNMI